MAAVTWNFLVFISLRLLTVTFTLGKTSQRRSTCSSALVTSHMFPITGLPSPLVIKTHLWLEGCSPAQSTSAFPAVTSSPGSLTPRRRPERPSPRDSVSYCPSWVGVTEQGGLCVLPQYCHSHTKVRIWGSLKINN